MLLLPEAVCRTRRSLGEDAGVFSYRYADPKSNTYM
jgi:hypothetical protein